MTMLERMLLTFLPSARKLVEKVRKIDVLQERMNDAEAANDRMASGLVQRIDNCEHLLQQTLAMTSGFTERIGNCEHLLQRALARQRLLNAKAEKIIDQYGNTTSPSSKVIRILYVAMLNSVHTARWLLQFVDSEKFEIHLFPVSAEKVHSLISREPCFTIHDYAFPKHDGGAFDLSNAIEEVIDFVKPDIVHTLEMQHSTYPVLPIKKKIGGKFPFWFYSCWGSDIKWFEQYPEHREKITEILANCDAMFSGDKESIRKVVEEYHFGKPTLNVPSPGGYRLDYYRKKFEYIPPHRRNTISVKGYSGWVYKPEILFAALKKCRDQILAHQMKVVVFLAWDVQHYVQELTELGIEAESFIYTEDYDDVMGLFSRSRLYLDSALCNGVPNAMLECMMMGCLPIVAKAGSTSEYITNGVNGILLDAEDVDGYAEAIKMSLVDHAFLENAAEANRKLIKTRLDYDTIREKVFSFYQTFIS